MRLESFSQTIHETSAQIYPTQAIPTNIDIRPKPTLVNDKGTSIPESTLGTSPVVTYTSLEVDKQAFDPANLSDLFERVKKVTGHSKLSVDTKAPVSLDQSSYRMKMESHNLNTTTADLYKHTASSSTNSNANYISQENMDDFEETQMKLKSEKSMRQTAHVLKQVYSIQDSNEDAFAAFENTDTYELEAVQINVESKESLKQTADVLKHVFNLQSDMSLTESKESFVSRQNMDMYDFDVSHMKNESKESILQTAKVLKQVYSLKP